MSLFASSAASRHLARRLLSSPNASASCRRRIGGDLPATATRLQSTSNLNSSGGSGLRRPRATGRRVTASKPPQSKAPPSSRTSNEGSAPSYGRADPHLIANEMVSRPTSAEGRAPGTEAVATLTREQKLSNYAMATGLLAFVSYVFYYSLASVGGEKNTKDLLFGSNETQQPQGEAASSPGFEEFLREANEGRSEEERRLGAEGEARGEALALEGAAAGAGGEMDEEERAMARTAGFVEGTDEETAKKRRPLWKRVVFFWRRE